MQGIIVHRRVPRSQYWEDPEHVANPVPVRAPDLEVWQVGLDQPPEWVEEAARRWLGAEERERAARGTPDVRRHRLVAALASRIVLAERLGRDPASLRFTRDAEGKPALARGHDSPLHFSRSTSAGRCLIALSSEGPIGVDLERVVAFPDFERIAAGRFRREETRAILKLTGEPRLRAFYECWTRKEAYLKATGAGLAGGLDSVRVTVAAARPRIVSLAEDDAALWTLVDLDLGEGFAGAAALRKSRPATPRPVKPTPLALATGP